MLSYVINHIFKDNRHVEVKSLDIAIDIPINILDLNYSVKGNMNRRIFDNGADDKTYYFRKGKSNGAIKIYKERAVASMHNDYSSYFYNSSIP